MKCVIEGNCVKAFGKAIHALSRIGDELWLDPMVKGLAVRSVNSAHSAYGCFLFSPMFFQYYSVGMEPTQDFGIIKCKLVMKSVLPLFRSLGAIERNVERCEISINTADSRVVFQFHCRHGITKTYNLGFHESEALQAVFASHLCPNVLKAQARLLGDMVMHFPVSQEEITLSMTPLSVILRNYEEISSPCKANGPMKMMYTEMSLHPKEFDYFQVGVDSDITFCLKELRGLLSFAESHGLPVSVHFGAAGRPVCFSVEDMVLEASVVLATLIDPDSRGPSQTTEAKAQAPITLRCGDAAEPLRGSHETEPEPSLQNIHPVTELVPSSHGSPLSNPASLSRQYTTKERCRTPGSVPAPTSSKICSLLFGALAEEQGPDGGCSSQSVLACSSDIEEDVEDEVDKTFTLTIEPTKHC